MRFRPLYKPMPRLIQISSMMMAALIFTRCSAIPIHDETFCSPLPDANGQISANSFATCDNFLSSNQKILSPAEWQALEASWIASGQAVECTNSNAIGDLKSEVEKACSLVKCDYQMLQTVRAGLDKIQALGKP